MIVEMLFNGESVSLNAVTMVGAGRQQMRMRSVGLSWYNVSDMILRTKCWSSDECLIEPIENNDVGNDAGRSEEVQRFQDQFLQLDGQGC